MPNMLIREALATDAAGIARVQVASWRHAYRGVIDDAHLESLSVERATGSWLAWFFNHESPQFCRVLADERGRVAGYAMGGSVRSGHQPFRAEVQVFYLHPDVQRQGHGAALLRSMARGFDLRGKRSLEIWSLAANPSRPFYERMGGEAGATRQTPVGSQRLTEVRYFWPSLEPLLAGKPVPG